MGALGLGMLGILGASLAGGGGGGGGAGPSVPNHPQEQPSAATLSGTIHAGTGAPATASAATRQVTVWKADGTALVGPTSVATDGSFHLILPSYNGLARVQVEDTALATNPVRSASMTTPGAMVAVVAVTETGDHAVVVTPLTTLAAMTLAGGPLTAETVAQASQAVAHWFGLPDLLQPPHPVLNADGSPAASPNLYGRVLAVLAATEHVAGLDAATVLARLAEALPHAGQAVASPEAMARANGLLLDGLEEAAAHHLDGPSAQALLQQWTQLPVHLGSLRQTEVNGLQTFTLTLTGNFKAGDHVLIQQDGAQRADLDIIVPNDTASLRIPVAGATLGQGDGARQFSASVLHADGAVSLANSLAIDYDAPPDAPTFTVHQNQVQSAGMETGASLQYSLDGGQHWHTVSGNSFQLPDGSYGAQQIVIRQIDALGQTSPTFSYQTALEVDTQVLAPTLALIHDTGLSATDGLTRDAAVRVGALEAGGTWAYSLDGGQTWTDGQGDTVPASAFPANGPVSLIVKQTDAAGNTAQSGAFVFTVDTHATAPTLALSHDTGHAGDGITSRGGINIAGLEADASWAYSLDQGTTWQTGVGTTIPDSVFTTDGPHTVQVRQTDPAGNVSAAAQLDLTLDTTAQAPTLSLQHDTGPSSTDGITSNGTVLVAGLEAGAAWQYSLNNVDWVDGSGHELPSAALGADGVKQVHVRQIDVAGNISAAAIIDFTLVSVTGVPTLQLMNDTGRLDNDGITRDATVSVGGLLQGSTWAYSLDGVAWSTGTGNTIPASVFTTDGLCTVQVRQTDGAGNVSPATTLSFTLDTTADPVTLALSQDTGSSGTDRITSHAEVSVTGLEPGATWAYSLDQGAVWQTGLGNSIPASVFTAEGPATVQVRQTDAAGNVGTATTLSFTLDTHADAVTLALGRDTGSSATDGITSHGEVAITGLEVGASWAYSLDQGAIWHTGVGASIPASVFTADGLTSVQVRQTDAAGNVGPAATLSFTLDTTADPVTLALSQDTGSSATDRITSHGEVSVAGLEPGATWTYSLDKGASWQTGTGTVLPASVFAADGLCTVQVRQTDGAGNVSPTETLSFTLDTTADPVTLALSQDTGSSGTDRITSHAEVSVAGLEPGATWAYSLDQGAVWQTGLGNSIPASVFTAEGPATVQVRQTDAAGNVGTATTLSFTLDTRADAVTLALSHDTGRSGTDGITSHGEVSVSGLEAGATWEYSLNQGTTWRTGTGTTLPANVFTADGPVNVQIRQTDAAGNVSAPETLAFTLDTRADTVALALTQDTGPSGTDRITNSGEVKLTGLEAGATWRYSLDHGVTWTTGTGTTIDSSVFTTSKDHSVQVIQTDVAGNNSAAGSLDFHLLLQGPEIDLNDAAGVQETTSHTVGLVTIRGGTSLTSNTTGLTTGDLQTLFVRIDGGLAADDQLTLDRQLRLDQDLANTGVTLAGVSGLSYQFSAATGLLSISKTDGSPLTSLEASQLSNAIRLVSSADAPTQGDRHFSIFGQDMAGNIGHPSSVTITVDTRVPTLDLNGAGNGVDQLAYVKSLHTGVRLFATDLQVGHENPQASIERVVITESGGGSSLLDQLMSHTSSGNTLMSDGVMLAPGLRSWRVSKASTTYTLRCLDGMPATAAEVAELLGTLHLKNNDVNAGQGARIFTVQLIDPLGNTNMARGSVFLDQTAPVTDLNGTAAGVNHAANTAAGIPWMLPVFNPATAHVVDTSPITKLVVSFSSPNSGAFGTALMQLELVSLTDGDDNDSNNTVLVLGRSGTKMTNASLLPGHVITMEMNGDSKHPELVITADVPLSAEQASAVLRGLIYQASDNAVPGIRELAVTATDLAGNTSALAAIATLSVLPLGTPLVFLEAASDTGAFNNDNVTRLDGSAASPLRLKGTGTAGATITVYRDANRDGQATAGESVGTAVCDSTGHWQLTLPAGALAEGVHDFLALDTARQLLSPALSITVDTRPPASSFGMGQSVSVTPLLTGVSDANQQVTVEIDTDHNLANGYELRYQTRTDATGHWQLDTASATPTAGTAHVFQNGDTVNARVTTFDLAGNQTVRTDSSTAASSIFDISDSHVVEGTDGTRELVFMVTRSGDSRTSGSVHWSVDQANSSARNSSTGLASEHDFSGALSGTVTFAPGETQQLVRFNVSGDFYREVNERLVLNLDQPTGGLVGDGLGIGNINEVDIDLLQGAYGMRNLNPNLNSSAIRVRRSSDGQELDIGFDANGDLDTKALLNFVGHGASDKGFVTTWYDQSGHGRDMLQSNANQQGVIVDGGAVIMRADGSVGISFNSRNGASDDFMHASATAGSWRSALVYAKVQSEGSRDGAIFNLGGTAEIRLGACYPEASGNRGYVFDVGSLNTGRLTRPVAGGNAALLGLANDLVFEAHSDNVTAGTAAANNTDAAQAIFENGVNVASKSPVAADFVTESEWQLARFGAGSSYYQQIIISEFSVYLAKDNSSPQVRTLSGTAGNDVLTFAGEASVRQIEGHAGHDTLYLSGAVNLDFAQMAGGVHGIEQVWMDNGHANHLTLTSAKLAANGSGPMTVVMGDGDSLTLDSVRMDYDAQHLQTVVLGQGQNDVLFSTARNDVMRGGAGADVFSWQANQGGHDTVLDFSVPQGDSLDLSALLQQMPQGMEALYLQKQVEGNGLVSILVDQDGLGDFQHADLTITLQGVAAADPINIHTGVGGTVL